MAKKYVPSGYQIIDLGSHVLSSTININKGENADVDVLIDLYNRGKIASKPILLHLNDESESYDMTTIPLILNGESPSLRILKHDKEYTIVIYDDSIEIMKESV